MAKAEIRRKDGTRVIIEGTEAEVKRILSAFQEDEFGKQQIPSKQRARKAAKTSIADMLNELKQEGFFDDPRSLAEIKNALAGRGRLYPVTTLSAQLIRQVRNRNLERIAKENKWMYVRRP